MFLFALAHNKQIKRACRDCKVIPETGADSVSDFIIQCCKQQQEYVDERLQVCVFALNNKNAVEQLVNLTGCSTI